MPAILNINVKCKCMSYQNCKKIYYYEIKTLQHWIKGHLQVNNNHIPRPICYQIWCGFWNQFFFWHSLYDNGSILFWNWTTALFN